MKGDTRAAARFVLRGHRLAVARLAGVAFVGGVIEAVFLITVTRAAFAITAGRSEIGIIAGRFLSVRQTLLFGGTLALARLAIALYGNWLSSQLAATVTAELRERVTAAFLRSSWPTQQSQRGGSLQDLLSSYVGGAAGVSSGVLGLVLAATNLTALLGLAISLDPVGAALLILVVGGLGSMLRPIRQAVRRRARANAGAGMDLAVTVNEVSQLGMELHIFNVREQALDRVRHRIEGARRRQQRLNFASTSVNPIYTALAYVALVGALGLASYSESTKLTSLGAVMLVMLRSLSYGQALQSAYTTIAAGVPYVEELRHRLAHFDAGQVRADGAPVGQVGRIEVTNVSFSYVEGQEVLQGVSFVIEPREIVGIVGPSGGGKSTLVQLLLGLRMPDSGTVEVDGRDVSSFDREEWARKVTFVPQASHLIAGTIADNIRFLRSNVEQDDIERAARMANLHDDVMEFPEGYQRHVGEQGDQLSGGQQQRLCIARALVERPDVLILDEPTSALDVRSEHLVRSTLERLTDRMTVIVIAHRLSTLEICDRIMVIQNGELRGFDTPERLEQSSSFYREALELSGMR